MNDLSSVDHSSLPVEHFFAQAGKVKLNPAELSLLNKIKSGLKKVESGLSAELSFTDKIADSAARYLLEAGGKRVRPAMVLLVAELSGKISDDVIKAAQVVEMTHLATLYHDDVMDESELRRGVPTAHRTWSNSVAILTGDLLLARASRMMLNMDSKVFKLQAETFERLCLGQLHETVGPAEGEDPIKHYIQVLADKTGSLLSASAAMGAILSGAPLEYELALAEYGEKVGVAFQLVDDVLDLSPQTTKTGKQAGTDLRSGVQTLPLLRLIESAKSNSADADLLERITKPQNSKVFQAAVSELWQHEVSRSTLAEAKRWCDEAIAALAPIPEGTVKTILIRFAINMVDRQA